MAPATDSWLQDSWDIDIITICQSDIYLNNVQQQKQTRQIMFIQGYYYHANFTAINLLNLFPELCLPTAYAALSAENLRASPIEAQGQGLV